MTADRRRAFTALTAAGVLWGTTVPLSKVALDHVDSGWLAFARFFIAGVVLACVTRPDQLRAVCRPAVVGWGAFGYGGSILVQNIGVAQTSVTHAALIVGLTPIMVAAFAAAWSRTALSGWVWSGAAVSVVGVGFVASGSSAGSSLGGDLLVLLSLVFACAFTVAQGYLLPGRDVVAVTTVQFLAASAALLPIAAIADGAPSLALGVGGWSATLGLAIAGTLLPMGLFAFGQAVVPAAVAGAFINLEPLVGVAIAALVMGEVLTLAQGLGAGAILLGLALTSRDQFECRGPADLTGPTESETLSADRPAPAPPWSASGDVHRPDAVDALPR